MRDWPLPESEISPSIADRSAHILSAIGAVEEGLRGISEDMLANDRMLRLAMERLFEIISVASHHIPSRLKSAEDGVDWQAMADIADRLENTRDRVETHNLWMIWRDKLTLLEVCATRHLREPN
jgi:uncharacterized protein with HEPN domain